MKIDTQSLRIPAWRCLVAILVLFPGFFGREVWTPDEPREAAITLAMSRTGECVVPELAGRPFVEKPPLYYIVGAAFLRVFGGAIGTTPALRMAGALWGLATFGALYLLAARLMGREWAPACVCIMALMPGFIQVSHVLIVDQALLFMVTASLWLMAEAYLAERPFVLIGAAAAAAGAFLAKGGIGPIVIAIGWLGLAIPRLVAGPEYQQRKSAWAWTTTHVLSAVLFAALLCAWLVPFRLQAGPELFHEWFWRNHAGRFLGQTPDLGHHQGPHYYFLALPLFVLPFLPMFVLGYCRSLRNMAAGGWRKAGNLFPCVLGLGGLLLLSLSGSKREIYLAALLPAFALAAGEGARSLEETKWLRGWSRAWNVLCLIALAALAFGLCTIPLWRERVNADLALRFNPTLALLACLALILAVLIFRDSRLSCLARQIAITALVAIAGLAAMSELGRAFKDYGPAFRGFAFEVAARPGLKPATWNLDETSRAGLYYFGNCMFWPELTDADEARTVLKGRHPVFNALIVFRKIGRHEAFEAMAPEGAETIAIRRMGRNRELRLVAAPVQVPGPP